MTVSRFRTRGFCAPAAATSPSGRRSDRPQRRHVSRSERNDRNSGARLAEGERAPFIRECADPACRDVLRLTLAEYEAVRANSTHFVVAPGHDQSAVTEEIGGGLGYVVVRKLGEAASTAAELDPRSD